MLDWDDLRFFLAIARHGSLTLAARDLRVAQSTVGRRLASLEDSLGVRLLHRTPDGYTLTLAGQDMLRQAERVETEALEVERSIGGRDVRLEGLVRVSCTETIAAHVLASCFAALQEQHPGILVELMPDPRVVSLAMREADIAVRLMRSEQHDLVVRRIGQMTFGLYASPAYLEHQGLPDFEAGCPGHRLMTLLDDIEIDQQAVWLADLAVRAGLGMRTSSHEALLSAARAGGGLACLARFRADPDPGLLRIETPLPPPETEIWLAVHKDSRSTPRVRLVLSAIAEAVQILTPRLSPPE